MRLDIAKFKDVVATLEQKENLLKARVMRVKRTIGNEVNVSLSRFLSDDRGLSRGATDIRNQVRKRGRPRKR